MIGRRRDRAKASAACCETVSVLIMLPIDMKNLKGRRASVLSWIINLFGRTRTQKLLLNQACTVLVSSSHRLAQRHIS